MVLQSGHNSYISGAKKKTNHFFNSAKYGGLAVANRPRNFINVGASEHGNVCLCLIVRLSVRLPQVHKAEQITE